MPVSWHSRLLVSSATLMFLIIVPSTDLPVASVSVLSSRLKPSLISGGSNLTARMYSSLHASSTCFKSTFINVLALHAPFAYGFEFDVAENEILDDKPDDDYGE